MIATLLTVALIPSACGDDATPRADDTTTSVHSSPTTELIEGSGVYGDVVTEVIPFGLESLDEGSPPGPLFIDHGAGALWVSHHRTHTVSRVDPETGDVVATIAIDPTPGSTAQVEPVASGPATGGGSLIAADDAVWVLDTDGFAWRIDPETNAIAARVELPGLIADSGIARQDGLVWVQSENGWMRIDEATNTVSGPSGTPITVDLLHGVAASPGEVWLGGTTGALRVNPSTGAVDTVVEIDPQGGGASPIGFASHLLWGITEDGVWAIDPATNQAVRSLDKPAEVDTLRADSSTLTDQALWVVAGPTDRRTSHPDLRQQLVRFDLATDEVTVYDLGNAEFGAIMGLTVAEGSVWATDFSRGNLLEVDVDEGGHDVTTSVAD